MQSVLIYNFSFFYGSDSKPNRQGRVPQSLIHQVRCPQPRNFDTNNNNGLRAAIANNNG
jgi:hypothetical protein